MGMTPDPTNGFYTYNPASKVDTTSSGLNLTAVYYGNKALQQQGRAGPQSKAAQVGSLDQAAGTKVDTGQTDQDRYYQMELASQLQGEANGTAPSLADAQMKQGLQQSLAQQAAMAGQYGGGDPALAMRNYGMMAGQQTQAIAGQSAIARMQEQQAAQNQLGGLYAGMRTQDAGIAGQNASFAQQAMMQNVGSQNAAQMANAGYAQQTGLANQSANLSQEQIDAQQAQYWQSLLAAKSANDKELAFKLAEARRDQDNISTDRTLKTISGIGGAMAMSDERAKTDIAQGEGPLREFLSSLGAHEYAYKDERHGKGRFVSPMAQELELSRVGQSMVVEGEDGLKRVDYARGLGAMLAAEAMHEKRLSALEEALKGKR